MSQVEHQQDLDEAEGAADEALKPRQQRFAEELALLCMSMSLDKAQAEAYVRAGYKPNRGNASRLAQDPRVQKVVERIQMDAARMAGVQAGRLLIELARIALINLDDLMVRVPNGGVIVSGRGKNKMPEIDYSKLTREHMAAVAEIDRKNGVVKFHDKLGALRDLLKFVRPDNLNVKHEAGGGLLDLMRAIDGRTKGLPQRQQTEGA